MTTLKADMGTIRIYGTLEMVTMLLTITLDGKHYKNSPVDVLKLGEGVDSSQIEVSREINDLILIIGETGERLTVQNWYLGNDYQLTRIEFADGTVWTSDYVNSINLVAYGTDGDDLMAEGLNTGSDTFIGGKGDDYLEGGFGNDTYIWNPGDGCDTIYDIFGNNIVRIGEGVSPLDVEVIREMGVGVIGEILDNLILKIGNGSIKLINWYDNEEFQQFEVRFADGTVWNRAYISKIVPALWGNDYYGDFISGTSKNETIDGKAGDDLLSGGSGNDVLIGGIGDDRLEGGTGNDTYIYSLGDGSDTIYDNSGTNVLQIGAGIDPSNIKFTRGGSGNNDAIFILPDNSVITVEKWFSGSSYQLAEIRFDDGTVWTKANINSMCAILEGTETGETITGTSGNDAIYGYGGDDTIKGEGGNDVLYGGTGTDRLEGGSGNDTYVYNLGDGHDTIYDNSGTNILRIGNGIAASDIKFTRGGSGNNGAIFIMPDGGRITIEKWFSGSSYQLAEIQFADGSAWTKADINSMCAVNDGTETGETITGTSGNDAIYGSGGDDTIKGEGGNDTLIGGIGDDRLEGGAGDDTYIWNPGDGGDTIYDTAGTNILQIGGGINPADVKLARTGASYANAVFILPGGERITVEKWFSATKNQLSEIRFSDGTVWTKANVNAMTATLEGTVGTDTITGTSGNDEIYGYDGSDTLKGGSGNDILIGGLGDDTLEGGAGNDTYIWNLGDGIDKISDSSGTNILKVGTGINPVGLSLTKSGNDLIMQMGDGFGGQITLQNWYKGATYQLASVEFADGTVWAKTDVNEIAAGTKSPFSTASVSMNSFAAGGGGDSEMTEALALLSLSSNAFDSYISDNAEINAAFASLLGADTGLDSSVGTDSSIATLMMNESEMTSQGDYDLARQDMDIAVAGLGFGSQDAEQTGDFTASAQPFSNPQIAASSGNNSLGNYFYEKENRQSVAGLVRRLNTI
jgi:Ca2+-binding RTX toxin-like protein